MQKIYNKPQVFRDITTTLYYHVLYSNIEDYRKRV